MMILNKLIFEAGGYSATDLAKASGTEQRQILQLGNAVIFSVVASMISWGYAATLLNESGSSQFSESLSVIVTSLIVLVVSLSINRNLIFFSDMNKEEMQGSNHYARPRSKAVYVLAYLRIALVLIVSAFNFKDASGILIIVTLGLFELYPLLLKKQMGQTILGRRIRKKLIYQQKRSELKGEEYARKIQEYEREILSEGSNLPTHGHVRLIK